MIIHAAKLSFVHVSGSTAFIHQKNGFICPHQEADAVLTSGHGLFNDVPHSLPVLLRLVLAHTRQLIGQSVSSNQIIQHPCGAIYGKRRSKEHNISFLSCSTASSLLHGTCRDGAWSWVVRKEGTFTTLLVPFLFSDLKQRRMGGIEASGIATWSHVL